MIRMDHREEALSMLQGKGTILDTAREVSRLMRDAGIEGAVIGGVAVVLHGYVRTTCDVDVFAVDTRALADALTANGFVFDPGKKEFSKGGIPIHLVTRDQLGMVPSEMVEIDDVITVSLPDLINMKLRSGSSNMLRAQDLADAIGLIRHRRLSGEFAAKIDKDLRRTFRELVKAIESEGHGTGGP